MINTIKRLIKSHFIKNYTLPDLQQYLFRIKELNFNPKVVFDIGAYEGSFALLINKVWKGSNIYCFEGLDNKLEVLHEHARRNKSIHVVEGLVGEENKGNVLFHQAETASSVLKEHIENKFPVTKMKMHRLDKLIEDGVVPIPNFIKIDTQGYEYQVLKGLGKYLEQVDMILAELNFIDIHQNVILASEVVSFLKENYFVPYDITEIHRRPLDKSVNQVDFVFIKKDSFLRQDKRWQD